MPALPTIIQNLGMGAGPEVVVPPEFVGASFTMPRRTADWLMGERVADWDMPERVPDFTMAERD